MFEYITNLEKAIESLSAFEKDKFVYLDTEVAVKDFDNIDFYNDRVRLIQIGNSEKIFLYDMFSIPEFSKYLKPFLEEKGIIGHNLKFDIKFLKSNFNIFPEVVFDTMIASQLLSENPQKERHSLSAVSYRFTENMIEKAYQKSSWDLKNLSKEQLKYAAEDIDVLRKIFPLLIEKLNSLPSPHKATGQIHKTFGLNNAVAAVEMGFVPFLSLIELIGMPIDKEKLEFVYKEKSSKYQKDYIEFVRKYGIDPFSSQKVAYWITSKLGLKLPKTQKGSLSSQDSALKPYIDRPEIKTLLEIRKEKKLLDKLRELKEYEKKGRIYGEFKQIGAPTGRMASLKPNLQNIPRELKFLFKAPEGKKLIVADYSQIELRIAAEYVNEETMIKAFKEDKDLHRYTASLILDKDYEAVTKEERQMAKAINFGLIYGISPRSLMQYAKNNYGIDITLKEAERFHARFFDIYENFKQWHEKIKKELEKHRKLTVFSLLGRKMTVSRFTDAVNYPIQATGSDILKMAAVFFGRFAKEKNAFIVNLVHDEIIVETKEDIAEEVKEILSKSMKNAGEILLKKVPIKYNMQIVDYWDEKE